MANERDTLAELQRISQLLATIAVKGENEGDALAILSRAGFGHAEIGTLFGLTSTAVKLRLLRKRRKQGKKERNQEKSAE